MATLVGSGTLYDADDNELGSVAYRIEHDAAPGEPVLDWSGEVNFDSLPDVPVEAGRYRLELEDGTRGEIDVQPAGASSGAEGQIAFTGAGLLDAQTTAGL